MSDNLRTRIADIVFDHGWNHGACDCGDCTTEPDYLPYDRGCHAAHVADAVIEAIGLGQCLTPPDNGLPPEVQIPPRAVGHWMTTGRTTDE